MILPGPNAVSTNFLSCSGLGIGPTDIISALFRSSTQLPDGFGFTNRTAIFTYQGRYAVHLICRLLNIGSGVEVIAPAYNCGAEIDPFVWAGAKVVYYRVDERGVIDIQDIMRRATPSTKLIYVSHFFGWPQDIGGLALWCKERNLFLLEDCALCLFSKGPNDTIGRTGNAAIYSFVKSLAVPDGGALVLNNTDTWNGEVPSRPPKLRHTLLQSLPLLKKWFMNSNALWQHSQLTRNLLTKSWLRRSAGSGQDIEPEMPQSNYFDASKIEWGISRLSMGLLVKTDPHGIIEARRRNYQYLLAALRNIPSIQMLYDDLPEHVCPLALPIYVTDRSRWANALEARGILVGGWPSYHRGFNWEDFPESRHLKNDLLTLPVHQGLEPRHMQYIAESVSRIAQGDGHHHRG
jgi:perosamine synthetase